MARVVRAWMLVFLGVVGCRERAPIPEYLEVYQLPGQHLMVSQLNMTTLRAIDSRSGETVWDYVRSPIEQPGYARYPTPTMVCPVAFLPGRARVVVRFHDEIHAVDVNTGRLVWRKPWGIRRFCPVASLDSGLLTITEWGTAIEKLNADGEEIWVYAFTEQGTAVTMPTVVWPTGDVVVRTRQHVLNVAPNGVLNWSVPHSVEPPP